MKKIIMSLLVACSLLFSVASVTAVDLNTEACDGVNNSTVCTDPKNPNTNPSDNENNPLYGPNGVLTKAIGILSWVMGVIAVIVLIVAGIRFSVSQGNAQSVTNVRNTIIYAVVGLVVAVIAQAVVQLVLTRLPN